MCTREPLVAEPGNRRADPGRAGLQRGARMIAHSAAWSRGAVGKDFLRLVLDDWTQTQWNPARRRCSSPVGSGFSTRGKTGQTSGHSVPSGSPFHQIRRSDQTGISSVDPGRGRRPVAGCRAEPLPSTWSL